MKPNGFNSDEVNLTALSALLGELVAKRWILMHAKKRKINGQKANLDIDKQSKKHDHARSMRSVDDRQ